MALLMCSLSYGLKRDREISEGGLVLVVSEPEVVPGPETIEATRLRKSSTPVNCPPYVAGLGWRLIARPGKLLGSRRPHAVLCLGKRSNLGVVPEARAAPPAGHRATRRSDALPKHWNRANAPSPPSHLHASCPTTSIHTSLADVPDGITDDLI